MVNTNFAQKPVWLNEDGSVANVVFAPINQNDPFDKVSFAQHFDETEAFKNADKADLSQRIFGDDRVESASEQEFRSLKNNFNKKVVQEGFNAYIANKSGDLINELLANDPMQAERFVLNKNRNAETSAFKVNIAQGDPNAAMKTAYNDIVDEKTAYHAELELMDTQGDQTYVTGKLNNITQLQFEVILAATGSKPGDFSKIARGYKNAHAAKVTQKIKPLGIAQYVNMNLVTGKNLETAHKGALENLETVVEGRIAGLGPGATKNERTAVYQWGETSKTTVNTAYQNAGSDAKYLFNDIANKVKDTI